MSHQVRSNVLALEAGLPLPPVSVPVDCRRRSAPDAPPLEGQEERRGAVQRGAQRHREGADRATVDIRGKTVLVKVLNISTGGIMIECGLKAVPGERLMIHLPGSIATAASVQWRRGGRIGLALDADLPELTC